MKSTQKIRTLQELSVIIERLKATGKTVVHSHGVFDLMHPGHIRHFEAARREGDVLIVTVTPDRFVNKGPGRPVFNERLRAESIASLAAVDFVAINEYPTGVEAIRLLKPSVYVKGSDYANRSDDVTGKIIDEERAVLEAGGRIHFTSEITFSSSKLLNSYFSVFPPETEKYLAEFRGQYTPEHIITLLRQISGLRVAVVGDAIIDEYHFCNVMAKSNKAASLNARFVKAESYAGGALAVANHVAGFCENVHLVTCLGEENTQEPFVNEKLHPNISRKFFVRPDAATTVKRRFVDQYIYQKMFEVSVFEDSPLPPSLQQELDTYLAGTLKEFDLVIVSDFGHGFINGSTIDAIIDNSKFLALNVQTNSANIGFNLITKFGHADYVCIDKEEMRLAYSDKFGELTALVLRTADELNAQCVTVTRGYHGSSTFSRGKPIRHTPVFSKDVVDSLGAGDAFLAVTSPCAVAGYPPEVIGFVGNAAGALAIHILGNKEPIDPVQLFKYITTLLK